MSRFVILNHNHPFVHWDLLLEDGSACRTWRLLTDPALAPAEISAEVLSNHRLLYLDYEGPVSGQRGTVSVWDQGVFEWRTNQPDICEVVVAGQKWQGFVRLVALTADLWSCSFNDNRIRK